MVPRRRAVCRLPLPIAWVCSPLAILLLAWPAIGAVAAADEPRPVWVFFIDKGFEDSHEEGSAIRAAKAHLSPRALARRAKVRGTNLTDIRDVPVCRRYIRAVLATGAHHRATSKWLNAVSVEADFEQTAEIQSFPFVREVRPLPAERWEPREGRPIEAHSKARPRYTLDYGESLCQVEPMEVPELHDQGLSGAGVLVCILDTGFLRVHDALVGVDVIAEWDFVNDDSVTANEPGDSDYQHNHGTKILSLIAGYDPGNLIGPAYGASYALAKTEDASDETPIEEDYWVEGIEWADSLGADIVSSSLCYWAWYTYEDMDGNTAVTTIAGDHAVANGIVVLNAAGNAGASSWHYIMAASDGDSVLGIGAVDTFGVITDFSSRGPSYDGRIKPDLVAVGEGNVVATPANPKNYVRESGTSCSCPLVAGVCALLLESHPEWTPMEVAEALKVTATHAASPDTLYGWGLVQAVAANAYTPTGVWETPDPVSTSSPVALSCCPNPFVETTLLTVTSADGANRSVTLDLFDVRGRRIARLAQGWPIQGRQCFPWDGRDRTGRRVSPGVYFARLEAGDHAVTCLVVRVE